MTQPIYSQNEFSDDSILITINEKFFDDSNEYDFVLNFDSKD